MSNATGDGADEFRYGGTMQQSMLSFGIYTICLLPLLAGYGRVRGGESTITLSPPWSDYCLVLMSYLLAVCLAAYPFVLKDDCGVYSGVVYVAGAMFVCTFFTKGLQAYFECRVVRIPPAATHARRRARGCMRTVGDFLSSLYLNDWYTFIMWFLFVFVIVAICVSTWEKIDHGNPAFLYCQLSPSSDFAVYGFASITVAMCAMVILHASLGIIHPVLGLWMFQAFCFIVCLTVALVAYIENWTHLEGLSWDPSFFFTMLYAAHAPPIWGWRSLT